MLPHEAIEHEKRESRLLCATCPDCSQRPDIKYDPGCTVLSCECRKIVLPDWQPKNIMRAWNACFMCKSFSPKTIQKNTEKYL